MHYLTSNVTFSYYIYVNYLLFAYVTIVVLNLVYAQINLSLHNLFPNKKIICAKHNKLTTVLTLFYALM
jgi:hypothetical protein